MKKLFLLFAVLTAVLSGRAEDTRPVVETAPGEESIYKAQLMAARSVGGDETQLDEICYRINFDGDKAYIYNLFSVSVPMSEYVVAEVKDQNIYIPTGFVYRDMGYAVVLVKRFVRDSEGIWKIADDNEPIVWSIGEDGIIRDDNEDEKIGLVSYIVDDESDPGMPNCIFDDIVLEPAHLANLQLPDSVTERMDFRCYVYYEMDDAYTNTIIQVARDGEDFYFKGLYNAEKLLGTECWIKGDLSDGVITIPSGQLVGIDQRGYFCYNASTYVDSSLGELVIDDKPVKFTFDEQTNRMVTKDWLLITQGHNYPFLYFPAPELTLFELAPATPAQPVFIMFSDEWFDFIGRTDFVFLIPYEDTEGNFIDPTNITFSLFMDSDEPYVFEPEQYPAFMEPVSEFGFYDTSNYVINTSSEGYQRHIAYFTTNSYEKLGVQSYYTVDGVRNASPIMWYDRSGSLIDKVEAQKEVANIELYDLMGRKVSNDTKGIVVKRVTYTDGTVKSVKETAR